jgi:hypothetical protein
MNTLSKERIDRQAFATAVGHGIHSLYLEPLRLNRQNIKARPFQRSYYLFSRKGKFFCGKLTQFAKNIDHNIEPRYFFEPDAREDDNDVPVVNMQLSATDDVLLNSPLAGKKLRYKSYVTNSQSYNGRQQRQRCKKFTA